MRTICKFHCTEASSKDGTGPHTARLEAVCDGSAENKKFFAATPFGDLRLGVMAEQRFAVGKEYYLTLEECSAPETVAEAARRGYNS